MSARHKIAAVVAEFLGTYVLASAMLAMLVRTNFEFFSAIAAALVYGLMLLLFGNVSGSHLNPALTLGLWTVRKISTLHALVYIIAQLLAGFLAWHSAQYFIAQALSKTAQGGLDWRVLISEGVGTLIFSMAVAAAVYKEMDNVKRAAVAGIGLFAGVAVASLASAGLLNPAVAIAARSVSWAYIVGPIVGAIVGVNLYNLLYNDNPTKLGGLSTASGSKSKKK